MKSADFQRGFTIIEAMLFLAITGLMLSGLMIGISGGVNRQRYEDSVTSLLDNIQGQYNLVDNVRSNRPSNYRCTSAGISETAEAGNTRGTSPCSVIGRFVSSTDGKNITSRPIYARTDITTVEASDYSDEMAYLNKLNLTIAPIELRDDDETYRLAWDTNVYTDKNNLTNGSFSMVVLRMPNSGLMRTFAVPSSRPVADTIANAPAGDTSFALCVNPSGLVMSPPVGVKILRSSMNVNGVERIAGGEGICS